MGRHNRLGPDGRPVIGPRTASDRRPKHRRDPDEWDELEDLVNTRPLPAVPQREVNPWFAPRKPLTTTVPEGNPGPPEPTHPDDLARFPAARQRNPRNDYRRS
ncbi:hypothetical protein GCM10025787_29750 [Saccharopolyspora rosea]